MKRLITFWRLDKTVEVRVNVGLGVKNCEFHFRFPLQTQATAVLMVLHLRKRLAETVQAVSDHAYEKGYQDGRKHRQKTAPPFVDLEVND